MSKCPTCGHEKKLARSPQDHKRFFAVIDAAFHQWPHGHHEQFQTAERLRHWLLIKANYGTCTTLDADVVEGQPAAAKLLGAAIDRVFASAPVQPFIRVHNDRIAFFWPKSIKWDTLSQSDFAKVRQAVEDVVEAELDVKINDLLEAAA
jgi:hypothetical protein